MRLRGYEAEARGYEVTRLGGNVPQESKFGSFLASWGLLNHVWVICGLLGPPGPFLSSWAIFGLLGPPGLFLASWDIYSHFWLPRASWFLEAHFGSFSASWGLLGLPGASPGASWGGYPESSFWVIFDPPKRPKSTNNRQTSSKSEPFGPLGALLGTPKFEREHYFPSGKTRFHCIWLRFSMEKVIGK